MSQAEPFLSTIQLEVLKQLSSFKSSEQNYCVALSGGVDSIVLLHIMKTLQQQNQIEQFEALHINHGLQQDADLFQQHCEKICQSSQIELTTVQLNLDPNQSSLEEHAREGRYQVFASYLKPKQILLMAHHLDDQAETLLFRLLRGTGIQGAAAIPQTRALAQGVLLRPLLNVSRQQINDYANQQNLVWLEDPTNINDDYSRNFLRHKILPLLKQKWPNLIKTFARFTQIAQEQSVLLDEVAEQDLTAIQLDPTRQSIDCLLLSSLSLLRQKNLLHYWGKTSTSYAPSSQQISQVIQQISAAQNQSIEVSFGSKKIRSFNQQLFICDADEPSTFESKIEWRDLSKNLRLPNGVIVKAIHLGAKNKNKNKDSDKDNCLLPVRLPSINEKVWVDIRRGGERCCPSTRQKSTDLKKIYQELAVPPWRRKWLPIIYYNEKIVAVAETFICRDFAIKKTAHSNSAELTDFTEYREPKELELGCQFVFTCSP